jgi:uncharacterized protein
MENRNMSFWDWTSLILVVIGGLNWGLVGFFGFNLVSFIFGNMSLVSRIIYALIGLSAIYTAFMPMMSGEEHYTAARQS